MKTATQSQKYSLGSGPTFLDVILSAVDVLKVIEVQW